MAILNDYTVEVIVDGQPATEYDDDDEPDVTAVNTVTKYVEAKSGKEFSFRIKIAPDMEWEGADCITVRPQLEGKKHTGIVMRKMHHNAYVGSTGVLDGEWSGPALDAKLYKYSFADLQTREMTKNDDTSKLKEMYGELGTLKLVLSRERAVYSGEANSNTFDAQELQAIPEKALKGRPLDVATTYKVHSGLRRPTICMTSPVDLAPVTTFVFKYRTRKALQSLLIVERSPTPLPLEERDPATLTREELEELVRRTRDGAGIKKENTRGVKRERSDTVATTPARPLKSSKVGGKTVYHIDSTDDEDENDGGGVTVLEDEDGLSDVEVVDLV